MRVLHLAVAGLVLSLAFALAACGGGSKANPANASFDLTIGDLVPLRGDLAAFGPAGRKSADLAARLANAATHKAGAKVSVKVKHADSETQVVAGQIAARKLISDDGATCLTGDWATAGTLGVANGVAAKDSVPLISPASTNFSITSLDDRGFVFRTAPPDSLQAIALADLAERSLGGARGKTISVAARDDDYGSEFARLFAGAWRKRGGRVTGPVLYDPTQADFTSDAKRIVGGNPSAFVIIDFPETYAKLAPALLKTGGFDAGKLFTSDTMIVKRAGNWDIPDAALNGAQATHPGSPAPDAQGKAFSRLFEASPVPPAAATSFAAQNFDATNLCFLAAVAAGSKSPAAIKDQIQAVSGPPGVKVGADQFAQAVKTLRAGQQIDYEGASGPLDLDAKGDPTVAFYDVLRYSGGVPKPEGDIQAGG